MTFRLKSKDFKNSRVWDAFYFWVPKLIIAKMGSFEGSTPIFTNGWKARDCYSQRDVLKQPKKLKLSLKMKDKKLQPTWILQCVRYLVTLRRRSRETRQQQNSKSFKSADVAQKFVFAIISSGKVTTVEMTNKMARFSCFCCCCRRCCRCCGC